DLRAEDDPAQEKKDPPYIQEQQERLLAIVRERREREDARAERARQLQANDPSRAPMPFYLGKGNKIEGTHLSPNGRWMFVRLVKESAAKDGQRDLMPNYVTESGYTETQNVRPLVGTATFAPEQWLLLD